METCFPLKSIENQKEKLVSVDSEGQNIRRNKIKKRLLVCYVIYNPLYLCEFRSLFSQKKNAEVTYMRVYLGMLKLPWIKHVRKRNDLNKIRKGTSQKVTDKTFLTYNLL